MGQAMKNARLITLIAINTVQLVLKARAFHQVIASVGPMLAGFLTLGA